MEAVANSRIQSVDLLKGAVMVIMALDHVRDYFHFSANYFDPADPAKTTLLLFFTRWITHFCAPAFSFLSGLSAYFAGRRKKKSELTDFLLKRGLWLIFVELVIAGFGWYFDIHFRTFGLLVLWSLGVSMIMLSVLIYLPRVYILIISCLLIFGHNLLDSIHYPGSVLWAIIHEQKLFNGFGNSHLLVGYPLVPWPGVMSLGYCFGTFYEPGYSSSARRKVLNIIGLSAVVLFIVLRWSNLYGNPFPWKHYDTFSKGLISFLNPAKYPPSLLYLLMTLGIALVCLANTEQLKGRLVNFFSMFGRVPFYYYILHLYFIHILAMIFAQLSGFGWQKMILPNFTFFVPELKGYGFSLWVVYVVWIGLIALLYPLCRRFDQYKQKHKDKPWLSYL